MKLKKGYVIQKDGKDYILVNDGSNEDAEQMMAFSNETAFFVLEQLSQSDGSLSLEKLVDAMLEAYDVPREIAERDISVFIGKLEEYGLVEYGTP